MGRDGIRGGGKERGSGGCEKEVKVRKKRRIGKGRKKGEREEGKKKEVEDVRKKLG